jgi:hypothetical protein
LLTYAQEADDENDNASVPNVWKNTNTGASTSMNTNTNTNTRTDKSTSSPTKSPFASPILRRRNSFEDRTGSSTDRQGRSTSTTSSGSGNGNNGRTPPSSADTTPDTSMNMNTGSAPRESVRWSEDVEELVFDQDPEERAFKASPPLIVAQGGDCSDDDDDDHYKTAKSKRKSKAKGKANANVNVNVVAAPAPDLTTTANVYVDKFLDDVDASLDNIELGLGDLINYVSGGDEQEEEEEEEQVQPQKVEVANNNSKPRRKMSSRVSAYLQAAEKKPQDETEEHVHSESENRLDNSNSNSNNDDDGSQDTSQDADELFASLMKTAPAVKKAGPLFHSRLLAGNPFLEKARKENTQRRLSGLQPSKLDTPAQSTSTIHRLKKANTNTVGLDLFAENQELGESFLPPGQSDGPAVGPTNMLIRTKAKKQRDGSDSISAITESTNMPPPRYQQQQDSKLNNSAPALTRVAETDEDSGQECTQLALNTTLGSDPFSGVDDDTVGVNTSFISNTGANVDFLSYFMAYMNNLSKDMYDLGSRVNTNIEATNKMVFDSMVISEEDVTGMFEHFNHDPAEDPMRITRAKTF